MIGKFGIGLKDALATFERKGVKVVIKSRHGHITLGRSEKHDFDDLVTLHAYIAKPEDTDFVGTEFVLDGVTKNDMEAAKDLFLRFSGDRLLEDTKCGAVLEKKGEIGRIYVNGVRVAEEENFLFSYNITSLTSSIRKAMNRERTNVGRSAYSDRIKTMLLACRTTDVAAHLVKDLKNFEAGTNHDELNWLDVQEHAVKTLSALSRVAFFTPRQLMIAGDIISEARLAGIEIVTIPEKLGERIRGQVDISGEMIRDLMQLSREIDESFEFHFVDESELTDSEREVFRMTESIFQLIGGRPFIIKEVVLGLSIVLGMSNLVSAHSTVYTKPYEVGACASIPFYSWSSYDLTSGYAYAGCKVGSGFTQATASLGENDGPLFTDLEVIIDCYLWAYLYCYAAWPPGYSEVCINVYLIHTDGNDHVEDSATVWSWRQYWGGLYSGKVFSMEHITETTTLQIPTGLGHIISNFRVMVEIYVFSAVFLGQAGVCWPSGSWTSPAILRVNSITLVDWPY